MTLFEDISLLCAQAQLYLLENYSRGEKILVAPENVPLFKRPNPTQPSKTPPTPIPQQLQASSPVKAAPTPQTITKPLPKKEVIPFPQTQKIEKPPAQEKKPEPTTFSLTEHTTEPAKPNSELLRAMKEMFPHIRILPPPLPEPSPTVALLNLGETPNELEFLHHIATALSICFKTPCRVVNLYGEKLDPQTTKLIIAAEHRLTEAFQKPNIPLMPLPDLSLLMQNPAMKATLWTTLCQHFAKYVR